jgi:putative flippase GtrA
MPAASDRRVPGADESPAGKTASAGLPRQFARYVLTGGLAAIVDIGLFHALVTGGAGGLQAAIASFVVAAAVNYVLTSTLVFQVRRRTARQAGLFLLFASIGCVANTGLTVIIFEAGATPALAKTFAIGAVFFLNFLMNRFIVFRKFDKDQCR